ncbi:MAG: type II toxin-antitoxin system MqsA family antitoxin [Syntrophobacteraceae bacterium]|jgi:YgiT-type zinc finger domain-containing protein
MKCAICQSGVTVAGYVTIVLEKDHTTLVFKKVPAEICENCGEEYISAEVNKALLLRAREELERGVVLEMLNFAA